MLEIEELEELLDEIRIVIFRANREGTLDEMLPKLGLNKYIQSSNSRFESYRSGKIVVIGAPTVKEKDLKAIAEDLGIDKNRFEFCLDYDKAQKYQFNKLKNNEKYRLILFGAVPHSTSDRSDSNSIIVELESNNDYPRVERLISGNELKITKTNFRTTLQRLLDEEYI